MVVRYFFPFSVYSVFCESLRYANVVAGCHWSERVRSMRMLFRPLVLQCIDDVFNVVCEPSMSVNSLSVYACCVMFK